MPKAYSRDLRERVITAVETGASRREAAERFEVSVASAVKWLQRWYQQRSAAPKPRGGSVSPLEEFAVEILDLIAQRPDLTLVETVAELRKRRIKTSRSSLWRFLDRHNIKVSSEGFSPSEPHAVKQSLGIGMRGSVEKRSSLIHFDYLTASHDCNLIASERQSQDRRLRSIGRLLI